MSKFLRKICLQNFKETKFLQKNSQFWCESFIKTRFKTVFEKNTTFDLCENEPKGKKL